MRQVAEAFGLEEAGAGLRAEQRRLDALRVGQALTLSAPELRVLVISQALADFEARGVAMVRGCAQHKEARPTPACRPAAPACSCLRPCVLV